MATMTISYDGRNKVARSVVDFIRSRVETFASSSEMFQSLGI